MKYYVTIDSTRTILITHNDSDGIGCALAAQYTTDAKLDIPSINTDYNILLHQGNRSNVWFYPINAGIKAITSMIKNIITAFNGDDYDKLDTEIINQYGFIQTVHNRDDVVVISIPKYILVADLPLNNEIIELFDELIKIDVTKPHVCIYDDGPHFKWFDHHESSKIFADKTNEWFIHTEVYSPGENISAAELMARYFVEHYHKLRRSYTMRPNADYVYNTLIPEISRYDTWEWRRHPKANDPEECTEWHVQALISAFKSPAIAFDKLVTLINQDDFNGDLTSDAEFAAIFNIRNYSLNADIESAKKNYRCIKIIDIDPETFAGMDYNVALMIVNSGYGSLVMESLYNDNPEIDIVVGIYPTSCNLSFRCSFKREDIHLDKLAEMLGGGGHAAAAGARVSKELMLHVFDLYYSTPPAAKIFTK